MTRVFEGDHSVPVTIVDTNSCVISSADSKGIELGWGEIKGNQALVGKYKELGHVPRHRVWISGTFEDMKIGDKVEVSGFESGEDVLITGITKGKGFAGVVKRYGFAGGPKTHGQSDRLRAPGSIGAGTSPGRVLKGKRMGGRMGGDKVTQKGKRVVGVKDSYILVSGGVPGANGSLVLITKTGK